MDISIKKNKAQSFYAWIVDNLRSQRSKPWQQLGVWFFVLSMTVLWLQH